MIFDDLGSNLEPSKTALDRIFRQNHWFHRVGRVRKCRKILSKANFVNLSPQNEQHPDLSPFCTVFGVPKTSPRAKTLARAPVSASRAHESPKNPSRVAPRIRMLLNKEKSLPVRLVGATPPHPQPTFHIVGIYVGKTTPTFGRLDLPTSRPWASKRLS